MFHQFRFTKPYRTSLPTTVFVLLLSPFVVSPRVAQSSEAAGVSADSQAPASSQSSTASLDVPLTSDRLRWQSLLDDQTSGPASQNPELANKPPGSDGKVLGRWQLSDQEEFAEHGKVSIHQGILILEKGYPATGVRLKGPFPKSQYEIELDAKRTDGGDFFCGLTFPVGEGSLTLILGGWGGWVVGLSCIDGDYAIDNETCTVVQFQQDRWYSLRLRVTESLIEVWIDNKRVIHLNTAGKELLISDRMDPCLPLGLATWHTTGAVRKIRYRMLAGKRAENSADNPKALENEKAVEN